MEHPRPAASEPPSSPPEAAAPRVPKAPLTAAIARGDERAFGVFYEAWFDRVLALARRITRRDQAFCMDVVQDVMMRVVRGMCPLDGEEAVHAWMARTVYTTAIDRLRADERRTRREREVAVGEAAPESAPEDRAARAEQVAWLRARLAELPEDDRRAVLERFHHDKTLAEVGRSLGITGHAAHGRLWRLVRRLRRAAGEWLDDTL